MRSDVWVVCCFFNPERYTTKLQNYLLFRENVRQQGLPLLTIELVQTGQQAQLDETAADQYRRIESGSVMWQKERLFNLACRSLPESCRFVLFSDADLLFQASSLGGEIRRVLQEFPVAQGFHRLLRLPPGQTLPASTDERYGYEQAGSWMRSSAGLRLQYGETCLEPGNLFGFPGGAWAMTRELAQAVGWYEHAVLGGGDVLFYLGAVGRPDAVFRQPMSRPQATHYHAWAVRLATEVGGRVGCLSGDVYHLWHGEASRRSYQDRYQILLEHRYDPERDVASAEGEALGWTGNKPELELAVRAYFRSRQEDDRNEEVASGRRIAIVCNMLDYLDASCGIGTYNLQVARLLATHGWEVTLVYAGDAKTGVTVASQAKRLAEEGIVLVDIGGTAPRRLDHPEANSLAIADRMEELLAVKHFDIVEVSDWRAPGFDLLQRHRFAPYATQFVVRLHGPSSWGRILNDDHPQGWCALATEFREQQTCEHAPHLFAPSQYIINFFRDRGWQIPHAEVVTLPAPEPILMVPVDRLEEVVYFGRIDKRKGVELFCEAVRKLPGHLPVTFLGPFGHVDWQHADVLSRLLPGRKIRVLSDLDREQALAYLSTGKRLAVLTSRAETYGYAVAECAANQIPFVTTKYAALKDVLRGAESEVASAADADSLAAKIRETLALSPQQAQQRRTRVAAALAPESRRREILDRYEQLLSSPPKSRLSLDVSETCVTLGLVIQGGDEARIRRSIEALTGQTHRHRELLVTCDPGWSSADQARALAGEFPELRWIEPGKNPLGQLLQAGSSSYFVPLTSFVDLRPHFVTHLLAAAQGDTTLAAVACHATIYRSDAAGRRYDESRFAPAGGPLAQGALAQNVFGELPTLFRRQHLLALGGFHPEMHLYEGWRLLMRLQYSGLSLAVLPRPLVTIDIPPRFQERSAALMSHEVLLQEFLSHPEATPHIEQHLRQSAYDDVQRQWQRENAIRYQIVDRLHDVISRFPKGRARLRRLSSLLTGYLSGH